VIPRTEKSIIVTVCNEMGVRAAVVGICRILEGSGQGSTRVWSGPYRTRRGWTHEHVFRTAERTGDGFETFRWTVH